MGQVTCRLQLQLNPSDSSFFLTQQDILHRGEHTHTLLSLMIYLRLVARQHEDPSDLCVSLYNELVNLHLYWFPDTFQVFVIQIYSARQRR